MIWQLFFCFYTAFDEKLVVYTFAVVRLHFTGAWMAARRTFFYRKDSAVSKKRMEKMKI